MQRYVFFCYDDTLELVFLFVGALRKDEYYVR